MDKFNGYHVEISPGRTGGTKATNPDIPCLTFQEDGDQYVLDCLDNLAAMRAIATDWQQLEQTCGEPFIYFQTYDWCVKWCTTFFRSEQTDRDAERCGICIYTLRRNNQLVMVWPMMTVKSSFGLFTQTSLTEPHGQYTNIICNQRLVPVAIGQRVWNYIRKHTRADAIIFDQYPRNSFLDHVIGKNGVLESSEKYSSAMDLTRFASWEEHRASWKKSVRKRRNQRRRRLGELGEIKFEVHYGGTPRYAELLKLGLEWKNVWLKETGRRAIVLSDERTRKFIADLEGGPAKGGNTPTGSFIGLLSVGDRPIALEISFCEAGRIYSYLGAFDWQLKKLSPGKLQLEEMLSWSKEQGFNTFDFLGEPADYKGGWTNATDELESRSVPVSFKGFIYCMFWKAHLRPLLRTIFNRLKPATRAKILSLLGMSARAEAINQYEPEISVRSNSQVQNVVN